MLERVSAEDDAVDQRRDDSLDTQDSIHGVHEPTMIIPTDSAGDIVLPSSIPRRADDSRRASSSTESKPATDASTLPIRGVEPHQLIAAGPPADLVRHTAGQPVRQSSTSPPHHHHNRFIALFWYHPSEPVPEENFWTLWIGAKED